MHRPQTLVILLVLALCLALLPAAGAESPAEDGSFLCGCYRYVPNADGTARILRYLGNDAELSVPSLLDGHPVAAIADGAFEACASLESVTLPEGILSLGGGAFADCWSLVSVSLPLSLREAGANPFAGCVSLTEFRLAPDHPVFESDGGVLFNRAEKTLVTYSCALNDASYSVPDGVAVIGDFAFSRCLPLSSVTLPEGVERVGASAFALCWSLRSVSLPDSLVSLGDLAFEACYGLAEMSLPSGLRHAGANPFADCTALTVLTVAADNPAFVSENGALCDLGSRTLVTALCALPDEARAVPAGTRAVGPSAFRGCTGMTSLSLPEGLEEIGEYAFLRCDGLTSLSLPQSLVAVGRRAFADCVGLTAVTLPENLRALGSGAFRGCERLRSVTLPAALTDIDEDAFETFGSVELTVPRDSFAERYAAENGLPFLFSETD